MNEHSPPNGKKEVKMTRLTLTSIFHWVISIIRSLDIPEDVKAKIISALEDALQDALMKSK